MRTMLIEHCQTISVYTIFKIELLSAQPILRYSIWSVFSFLPIWLLFCFYYCFSSFPPTSFCIHSGLFVYLWNTMRNLIIVTSPLSFETSENMSKNDCTISSNAPHKWLKFTFKKRKYGEAVLMIQTWQVQQKLLNNFETWTKLCLEGAKSIIALVVISAAR